MPHSKFNLEDLALERTTPVIFFFRFSTVKKMKEHFRVEVKRIEWLDNDHIIAVAIDSSWKNSHCEVINMVRFINFF